MKYSNLIEFRYTMIDHPIHDPTYRFYTTIPIISIIVVLWNCIFNDVNNIIKDAHTTQNIVNLIHASFVSMLFFIMGSEDGYVVIWCLSCGFFISDIVVNIQLSLQQKKNPIWNPFIYHHLIACYGIGLAYFGYHREIILTVLHYLELSNLMMYVWFISTKIYPTHTNLHIVLLHYQFMTYVPLRLFIFPYYFFIEHFSVFYAIHMSHKLYAIIIFAFGIVWSKELLNRCMDSIRPCRMIRL
jgi:hypothetical protein